MIRPESGTRTRAAPRLGPFFLLAGEVWLLFLGGGGGITEWQIDRSTIVFFWCALAPLFFFSPLKTAGRLLPKFPRIVQPRHVVGSSFFFVSELARQAGVYSQLQTFCALTVSSDGRATVYNNRPGGVYSPSLIAMHTASALHRSRG